MASTSTTTSTISALGGKLVVDLAVSGNDQGVNDNVTSATSGKIYLIEIDNPNGASLFVKIRDASSATPSTTTTNGAGTPHMVLYCPAQSKTSYAIPGGFSYSAGVSFWANSASAVGSVTSASNSSTVRLVCS